MNVNRFLGATELFLFSTTLYAEKNTRSFPFEKAIPYKNLNYITCPDTSICRVKFLFTNRMVRARDGCHRRLNIKRKFY